MNRHARIGAEILGRSRVPLFRLAAEVALSHLERFDGKGYPDGLAGSAIPLSGRIVSVVDFFDALTMDRCYRKAVADDRVREMMLEQRGAAFDPEVIDLFLSLWPRFVTLRGRINQLQLRFTDLVEGNLGALDILATVA
jgi:putative two-component system response regulator